MRSKKTSFVIPIFNDKTLFQERPDGTWSLFGGHLNEGESKKEAGKREFLEESGVDIQNIELIFFGKIYNSTFYYFEVDKMFDVKLTDETIGFKWVEFNSISKLKLTKKMYNIQNLLIGALNQMLEEKKKSIYV